MNTLLPNAYIIGAQKAGTTSLNNWLSQHPDIYCYRSLKDVHLFAKYKSLKEIYKRLAQEPKEYHNEPVILQSAVNYIFYPPLLEKICECAPFSKLILVLRNPVERAFSAYAYFTKILREKRSVDEALMYDPKDDNQFSMDNNDFTYIEHGFYYRQIKACFEYFSSKNVLVIDYECLNKEPDHVLPCIFSFLKVEQTFMPNLTINNITGTVKNSFLQNALVKKTKARKLIIKYLVDPWLSSARKELIKQKLFEFNTVTSENKNIGKLIQQKRFPETDILRISDYLTSLYLPDTYQLDQLLGTNYYRKWFNTGNIYLKANTQEAEGVLK